MKKMLVNTLSVGILMLHGCGGGSDGGGSKDGQSTETLLKISNAVQKTPSSMDNGFKSNTTFSSKMMQKVNAKANDGTYNCSPEKTNETDNGTYTIKTLEDGTVRISYDNCYESKDDTFTDGISEYYIEDKGTTSILFSDYIYWYLENDEIKVDYYKQLLMAYAGNSYLLNGDMSFGKYENEKLSILEEDNYEKFLYLEKNDFTISVNGQVAVTMGSCGKNSTSTYKYQMEENSWLTINSTNPDFIDSGEITINDTHYVYEGNRVQVTKGSKSNTFTQRELLDEEIRQTYAESCSKEPRPISSKMTNGKSNYKLNIEKFLNRH